MSIEVLPKLYQIVVPTPFAVGPVNCYVALSDPITLIDVGPRQPDSRAALHAGLSELGLKTSDLRRIIITHAHADHYGLAAELVRESGAELMDASPQPRDFGRLRIEPRPTECLLRADHDRVGCARRGTPARG